MTTSPVTPEQLGTLLAGVSAVHDVDVVKTPDGVRLAGLTEHTVPTRELCARVRLDAGVGSAIEQLYHHLACHSLVASLGDDADATLRTKARVVALPATHACHPGEGWVRHRVPGGVLHAGIGLVGVIGEVDHTVVLPPSAAALLPDGGAGMWAEATGHAEDMATLALARLARDTASVKKPVATLRAMGGVDVLALLTTTKLRAALTAPAFGLRAVAAPTRKRAWVDLMGIDPAFVAGAWSASNPGERGVDRAMLVTRDEVGVASAAPERRRVLDLTDTAPAAWRRLGGERKNL